MGRKEYYGVFLDIRNYAYVCSAPQEKDLHGACYITTVETDAREMARSLNAKRRAKTVLA